MIAKTITEKLTREFRPVFLELIDESHRHSVQPGAESHFNLVIVSPDFHGKSHLDRQRAVLACLREELQSGVHALTMKTKSVDEWEALRRRVENPTPACRGGAGK